MITKTINNKQYSLVKVYYDVLDGIEKATITVKIVEDIPFGTHEYFYETSFNADETALMIDLLSGNFSDYVVNKLVQENA